MESSRDRETFYVCLILVGLAAFGFGLYSLIAAFHTFDRSLEFWVWFLRAMAASGAGVCALETGATRIALAQRGVRRLPTSPK